MEYYALLYYQIGESYEVRAFTFKALTQVLKCAGDKKLKEVQLCLEGLLMRIPIHCMLCI